MKSGGSTRGKLAGRGDPAEMLRAYGGHIARRVRAWGDPRRR